MRPRALKGLAALGLREQDSKERALSDDVVALLAKHQHIADACDSTAQTDPAGMVAHAGGIPLSTALDALAKTFSQVYGVELQSAIVPVKKDASGPS